MVRSLWTAATGMNGQQQNLDTISNNLSNVNTTGFKQQRVECADKSENAGAEVAFADIDLARDGLLAERKQRVDGNIPGAARPWACA